MSFELSFFQPCDHRTKSEPLIIDTIGVGSTSLPIANSNIRVMQENIEVIREPIIRSNNEIDSLFGLNVTNIDLVVQEILHNGVVEKRQYQQGVDFTLSGFHMILWLDTSGRKPNPGELYFVNYRMSQTITNYRVLDSNKVKISSFDDQSTYLVDYPTFPEYCTKCIGADVIKFGKQQRGRLQDIVYGPTGDFQIKQGTEKLKQDLIRAVLAIRGSNPREPSYGTIIEQSIETAQSSNVFGSILAREVRNSLLLLRQIQQIQASVQDKVDPSEILRDVLDVRLVNDAQITGKQVPPNSRPFDPTQYHISVTVQSAANNLVDFFVPLDDVFSQDPNDADTPFIQINTVTVSNISKTSAVITWRSNINTDSIIDFGETDDLSNRTTSGFGINHLITLNELNPGTLYYFKVASTNRGFVQGAELRTLKTLS